MSNKTLVMLIILIIVVAGAAAGYFYWQQTKPLKVETMDQTSNANDQPAEANPVIPAASPEADKTASTTPPVATNPDQCVRNFDQNKLNTDKVSISGRQVEMDVKNFGKISLEFYDKDAPKTVENFLRLVNSGYYNCLTFHRVAKGFVIQAGDPNGNGTGGFSAFGKPFADELNTKSSIYQFVIPAGKDDLTGESYPASVKSGYAKGILAMANSGPNTNGSQFFIMLNDVPTSPYGFDAKYTIFGKVTSGLDVVDRIGKLETSPPSDGAPKVPVVMQSVKIIK